MGASALKVWITLWQMGGSGHTDYEQIANKSGVGERTVPRTLKELSALGWLRFKGVRGEGIFFKLLAPPVMLTKPAAEYFHNEIDRKREKLDDREARIDQTAGSNNVDSSAA